MSIEQYFNNQIEAGATEMFFYCLEREITSTNQVTLQMFSHKGKLDSFPANVKFVRMAAQSTPVFKEVSL